MTHHVTHTISCQYVRTTQGKDQIKISNLRQELFLWTKKKIIHMLSFILLKAPNIYQFTSVIISFQTILKRSPV